ncbi:TPA_asm: hypothetical protein GahPV1_gp19 [Geoglobus ahangari pleomorphic virus 1]|uniref:Uncharacterized protein n=2 Tax=root TaxID=1 RepID=A0A0F7II20_9EURY|nr:hypothetical protein [Geoglobus ahangari]AKG92405.1 hypothetical protein GAH_00239 [Geoglobus ahangari]
MSQENEKQSLKEKIQKIPAIYKRNFMQIDLIVVLIFTLILAITVNPFEKIDGEKITSFYLTMVTLFGGLTGFIITGVTILLFFLYSVEFKPETREILERFKKSKQYPKTYDVFYSAIKFSGATAITSLLTIIFNWTTNGYLFYLVVFLSLTSVDRIVWSIWILETLTKNIIEADKNELL